MDDKQRPTPYGSARDLPSYLELAEQIRALKVLTLVIGRHRRVELLEIERRLNELVATVDQFYELLGDRNWIFHDDLNLKQIQDALRSGATAEVLEERLIAMYQEPKVLEFMIQQLKSLPAMRIRHPLIRRALDDYRAARYYSTTLVLLTVMDGFVNDIEVARIGLHARSPEEMVAWDSVVGHHKGLSRAHHSFRKRTSRTTEQESFELHRNGILHGTILNYDNVIVATKAWNRLFAVADWARSIARQSQPPKPLPSFKDIAQQLTQLARDKKILANWKPYSLTPADQRFGEAPIHAAVHQFLDAWKNRNYGAMSSSLPDLYLTTNRAAKPVRVRELYERSLLGAYQVEKFDFVAAAACEVDVVMELNGETIQARLRWIRENPDTNHPAISEEEGRWRLYTWSPHMMVNRRK